MVEGACVSGAGGGAMRGAGDWSCGWARYAAGAGAGGGRGKCGTQLRKRGFNALTTWRDIFSFALFSRIPCRAQLQIHGGRRRLAQRLAIRRHAGRALLAAGSYMAPWVFAHSVPVYPYTRASSSSLA